jgi:hypothetical protein
MANSILQRNAEGLTLQHFSTPPCRRLVSISANLLSHAEVLADKAAQPPG